MEVIAYDPFSRLPIAVGGRCGGGCQCVALSSPNTYDIRVGPVHLVAHGLFKPLLILNGIFLLTILLSEQRAMAASVSSSADRYGKISVLIGLVILHAGFSFRVNALDDEWNYRGLSSGFSSIGDLANLFVTPQIGGSWYRPLGFVSLWLDYRIFHQHIWGYHVQNLLLHLACAFLAWRLAKRMGMTEGRAQWAAVLFAAAAVAYEPVMWPSARFDLIAMLLTLLALIAAIDYVHGNGGRWLWASLGCYLLALLSKESGYAFPILAAICIWFLWRAADARRAVLLAAGVVSISVSMLVIRLVVMQGLGGYVSATGTGSPHLSFGAATLRSIFTKALPLSLLNVNLTGPMPRIMLAVICAAALLFAVGAAAGAATGPRKRMLICCALAAMVPVATLLVFIDASDKHIRYLYMPALFVMMLVAEAFSNARWPALLLTAFAWINLCCAAYNIWVYKTTYQLADALANRLATDYSGLMKEPARILVSGMPPAFNGVLFSQPELQYRFQRKLPGVEIRFTGAANCGESLCYVWHPEERILTRY